MEINSDNRMASDSETLMVALAYYQYKLADCPFGDNLTGLAAWVRIRGEEFEDLCDRSMQQDER